MVDFGKTLIVTGGGLGDTLFHLPFIRSIQNKITPDMVWREFVKLNLEIA